MGTYHGDLWRLDVQCDNNFTSVLAEMQNYARVQCYLVLLPSYPCPF
jgi:hypothetical protein